MILYFANLEKSKVEELYVYDNDIRIGMKSIYFKTYDEALDDLSFHKFLDLFYIQYYQHN